MPVMEQRGAYRPTPPPAWQPRTDPAPLLPDTAPYRVLGTEAAAQADPGLLRRLYAQLVRGSGAPQSLDAPAPDIRAFAAARGSVYTVTLPPNLGAGDYRLVVETALGREKATREVRFKVVGG